MGDRRKNSETAWGAWGRQFKSARPTIIFIIFLLTGRSRIGAALFN
jgi:hypothetical protein